MSPTKIGRRIAANAPLIASLALALALASPAGSYAASKNKEKPPPPPHATTGAAVHVLGTSALLTAVIDPNEAGVTRYYFQYGPTTAYGSQTPTASLPNGNTKIKVGQAISKLQVGVLYHFRVVASVGSAPLILGSDHSFTTKGATLKFEIAKVLQAVVGTPFIISGTLTGLGAAHHQVVLQASPYPYLEAFTNIGARGVTDAAGRFSFRVANLSTSTQFRVITLDARPIYSPVFTVQAAVRVTLQVRKSKHPGLVRLYGTVTPAVVGSQVYFQVEKAVRPGKSEASTKFASQFVTVVKKGGRAYSRFSAVVNVHITGTYRAFVRVRSRALVSGSSPTVVLHAGPTARKGKKKG